VEFAVKNGDGAEPRNLPKADLVLVGQALPTDATLD
jgi:regulator of PEP synthase PpsR (kinase-PPPase family)